MRVVPSSPGQRVGHTSAFAFPARKQFSKRKIQDVLEEHSTDKGQEAKRKKVEEGEALGGGVCVHTCVSVCLTVHRGMSVRAWPI